MVHQAANIFRKFHLKRPNGYIKLNHRIPEKMSMIGFGIDIGYYSDKWNDNGDYEHYVHFFEHQTDVLSGDLCHVTAWGTPGKTYLINPPDEVTFLGFAVDTHISKKDRSYISRNENKMNLSPIETSEDARKRINSMRIEFNPDPRTSTDYVVSDPEGKIVYIIRDKIGVVYAFINRSLEITQHGIEG